jgi:hypothetical protein
VNEAQTTQGLSEAIQVPWYKGISLIDLAQELGLPQEKPTSREIFLEVDDGAIGGLRDACPI